MLILHTSDWHLGRSFHGTGMLETQRDLLTAIVTTVRQRGVELVLISGDVYDRALPPVEAVELLDHALAELRQAGAQVIITSGNHDSATRLGFGGRLLDSSGVYVRTRADTIDVPIQIDGADGEQALVYGIPYLEPRLVAPTWKVEPHHTAVISEAMRRIRENMTEEATPQHVTLVMAHVFASGATGSDSERDIGEGRIQGGLGQVPINVFEGVHYTALGHLHGRQTLADTVRYAGSPLAYSFSESQQAKGGWLLHLTEGTIQHIEPIEWNTGKKLAVLTGTVEELLNDSTLNYAEDAWCQITVTDPIRPPGAYTLLKQRFPGLLNYILAPTGGQPTATTSYAHKLDSARSDIDMCTDFVEHVRTRPANHTEQRLLAAALEQARLEDTEAQA